ncbi:30S ribosomal protein S17 [Candidatus Daviesbacteria bacterium]|nr:30S ribosomal protein S17 [Candidatus Daviesbacteria bacterium]
MVGRVVSTKMKKSAVVLVESNKKHPLYGKIFLRTKKYLVDDPKGVKNGDVVEFIKVRPISKNKHWQISKVLGTDEVALGTALMKEKAEQAISEVLPESSSAEATEDKEISEGKKVSKEVEEEKNQKDEKVSKISKVSKGKKIKEGK